MPCQVSDSDARYYECEANRKKYGVHATRAEIASTVACELGKILRRVAPDAELSELAQRWIEVHEGEDRRREANRRREQNEEKVRQRALEKLSEEERAALGVD